MCEATNIVANGIRFGGVRYWDGPGVSEFSKTLEYQARLRRSHNCRVDSHREASCRARWFPCLLTCFEIVENAQTNVRDLKMKHTSFHEEN